MIVSEHFPSAPLNSYINALRYCEGPAPYRHLKVLPAPALNLMINFDEAYNCYKPEQTRPFATYAESWSMGLWNTHHILDWPRNMQLFVVEFKPGGAYPFLHLPLSELHNDIVPMDAIWGNLAAEIRERLYSAATIQARFLLLEQVQARIRAYGDVLAKLKDKDEVTCHILLDVVRDHIDSEDEIEVALVD